jgi:hypothetical protein
VVVIKDQQGESLLDVESQISSLNYRGELGTSLKLLGLQELPEQGLDGVPLSFKVVFWSLWFLRCLLLLPLLYSCLFGLLWSSFFRWRSLFFLWNSLLLCL